MRRFTHGDLRGFAKRGMAAQVAVDEIIAAPLFALEAPQASRRKPTFPEQQLQRAVCELWALQYPTSWALTFHVPNELRSAHRRLAGIFSALGVKSGVPDLLCLQRRGPFTGFALELKSEKGSVSDNQVQWHERLRAEAYCVGVAFDLDQARELLALYHRWPEVASA